MLPRMTLDEAKEIFRELGADVQEWTAYPANRKIFSATPPEARLDRLCEGIMQIYLREPDPGESENFVYVWGEGCHFMPHGDEGSRMYDAASLIRIYRDCRRHNHDVIARSGLNFGNPLNV